MSASRVALLPFENLSDDPADAHFARGFSDDVAAELARVAALDVIHPDSAQAWLQGRVPFERRAEAAGVAWLLRGSVRSGRDVLRIAVRLVRVGTGEQIWAERFDAPAERLFEVQDEIAARVAASLSAKLDGARLAEARRKPPASLSVYDRWLRGLDRLRRGTLADDAAAREEFERALALDPHFARAWAGISLSHFNEWSCQAWERWDETERLAFDAAQRAAALDDGDALVQLVLARILLYRRDFDGAERHVARGLALAPNDADVLANAALCRVYLGDSADALERLARAKWLHPHHPEWYEYVEMVGAFALQRFSDAETAGARVPDLMVDLPAHRAAACALAERPADAARQLARFLAGFREKVAFGREPDPGEPLRWVQHVNPYRRAEDAQRLADGLRRAGLAADPDLARPAEAGGRATRALLQREGELWRLAYEGIEVRISDAKGLHDLAELLARPGEALHALDLAGRAGEPRGDAPVLDARARAELRERVRELEAEVEDAERAHDLGRAERARAELDRSVEEITRALGIGGRARRMGGAAERARSAVTWRIRSAVRKIGDVHPALGRHLERSIRTGTTCVYAPERPVDWEVGPARLPS